MNINKVYKSSNIEEVLDLLEKYQEKAKVIAGGTDIIIALKNEKISPQVLIDISHIEELKAIEDDGQYISIGAGVSFTELVENPLFDENLYGLHKACKMVGSPQIRNKGTLGGNIANGSSAADSVPPLMALESILSLESKEGKREISLEDYYHNPIKDNELLTKITFKKPKENQVLTFSKLGLRKALAISRLTLACLVSFDEDNKIGDIKIGSGALAKYPMREKEVEEYLLGKELNHKTIEEAVDVLKDSMDERLKGRSTLAYKRVAIKTILKEALDIALDYKEGMRA